MSWSALAKDNHDLLPWVPRGERTPTDHHHHHHHHQHHQHHHQTSGGRSSLTDVIMTLLYTPQRGRLQRSTAKRSTIYGLLDSGSGTLHQRNLHAAMLVSSIKSARANCVKYKINYRCLRVSVYIYIYIHTYMLAYVCMNLSL